MAQFSINMFWQSKSLSHSSCLGKIWQEKKEKINRKPQQSLFQRLLWKKKKISGRLKAYQKVTI